MSAEPSAVLGRVADRPAVDRAAVGPRPCSGRAVRLDDEVFAALRALLLRLAGLEFDPARRASLGYSIAERLRATGLPAAADYLALLDRDAGERQALLDEVTIQETHFFRNPPQMRALRTHVLPQLLSEAADRGRRLRIWSAGCSTGEEPYTLAMMLRELLGDAAGWDLSILATDLSQGALAAARAATYGPRALQLATTGERDRFFTALPDGRFAVRPEVRELVQFRHHNLVREPAPASDLDLVLCRNVTIYFARDTTRALVSRVHAALRHGGYLFLGHSETLWQVSEDFRLVTVGEGDAPAFVYQRFDGAVPARRPGLPGGPARNRSPVPPLPLVPPRPEVPSRPSVSPDPGGSPAWAAPPVAVASAARAGSLAEGAVDNRAERGRGAPEGSAVPPASTDVQVRAGDVPDAAQADDLSSAAVAVRTALGQGRYDDAARLAALAAEREPLRASAHYLLGLALSEQQQDQLALPPLRRAVYLDPDDGLAHFLLASVLARLGDGPAATREYRAAALTLVAATAPQQAPELGGRSVRELATLCAQLSAQPPVRRWS